ncbi:MAG: hypothetical protein IIA44_02530 [Acidobacteria bacterium]|nr:hypothetical protein [Acidobacteriota bacterium]
MVVFWDVTRRKKAEDALQRALVEVEALKHQLEEENTYLQEEIEARHNFGEIIGTSPAVARVTQAIATVAPTFAAPTSRTCGWPSTRQTGTSTAPGGAAELLGVKPTTLASRIKKTGLKRPTQR